MSLTTFFRLVDIEAKLASLFPFLLGTFFSIFYFHSFNLTNSLLYLAAIVPLSMAVTMLNHYTDYRKALDPDYKTNTNIIGKQHLNTRLIAALIVSFITLSLFISLWLTLRTNLLLLIMGAWCFFVAIFYSFGPVPLSRMPLGEVLSGLTEGILVFFIAVWINQSDQGLLNFQLTYRSFAMNGDWLSILTTVLVALPVAITIASVMLANNICDLDKDILNQRYTLPYYIGKDRALNLFAWGYYAIYLLILVFIVIGIYHPWMALVFLTLPKVRTNIYTFQQSQDKSTTFFGAIQNLLLLGSSQLIGLVLSILL